ncbi:MAG: MiaB/RimO family radical SAM methylthiotransferase, partial [Lentisphaerae bacterium]|nr:MiaB/RimO family radical SAM methylthiotransferase [Lentisphaerota bacterium]
MPSVAFKTIGCRLNQSETAAIAAAFSCAGFSLVDFSGPADSYVIHTCCVTARAEQTCRRTARAVRLRAPRAVIALAGCAVQTAPDRTALAAAARVDIVADQQTKTDLPRAVLQALGLPVPAPSGKRIAPVFDSVRALLKVQDGCDFGCRYCIVPRARGPARSRPMNEVLNEAGTLAREGYTEFVVTGANLGCYEDGRHRLPELLEALAGMDCIRRIRLSSIECSTVEREVVDLMAASSKICRFLHLPLQSGDDGILLRMGRRYTAAQFEAAIAYAARRLPGAGIGSDVITGLPGEDDAAFARTEALIGRLPLSNLHVFPFSPRPGTAAAEMENAPPESVRTERAAHLSLLGGRKREEF